jgi:NAD(P)-dependent dehydrogenase (short-subunit alcohol dehydrogenase family)
MAQQGWRVFAGVRKEADAQRLAGLHPRILPLTLDVTRPDHIAQAAERVAQEVGPEGLKGLVNNAGIAVASPLEFVDLAELRYQFEVNVFGLVETTQAFLPLLRAARGRVVMMGSVSGRVSTAFMGPYAGSKYALEAIGDALRQELLPWGMHVALVEPGRILTPIWEKGRQWADQAEPNMPPLAQQYYGKAIARLRQLTVKAEKEGVPPEEVAKAVQHALVDGQPKARYVVGPDAHQQLWIKRLAPTRIFDRMLVKYMNHKP